MKPIKAKLQTIRPNFFSQAEIDGEKVAALVAFMRAGGSVPHPVVVNYAGQYMPIDGHHRLSAAAELGRRIEAWVVRGRAFEDLDMRCREDNAGRAEDYIDCGGVPALKVATPS